ncbi:MAG: hypothetical protein IKG17_07800 [Mogibacterium sp.]|nr:hypothetical protein [Mogibacterium sp.]
MPPQTAKHQKLQLPRLRQSRKTCHWLPDNFRDAMKQRRAQRAVSSGNMIKK